MFVLIGLLIIGAFCNVNSELTIEEREKAVWASSEYENDTSVRTTKVSFGNDMITQLKRKLNRTRKVTKPYDDVGFSYGFNTDALSYWVDYWGNKYNFTEREIFFNQFTHYLTNIQGLDVHFLWGKPEGDISNCKVVPVLLVHGFTGSFREFYGAIPELTRGCVNGIALAVVVPSIPGFGLSSPATKPGLGPTEIGTVFKLLMARLGYDEFCVQGGDMGAIIVGLMSTLYPKQVIGHHTNFALSLSPTSLAAWIGASSDPSLVVDEEYQAKMFPFLTIFKAGIYATGYMHVQTTKTDNLGIALSDSPAGLLAYQLTLMSDGTRLASINKTDGGLDLFAPEVILDNLMMYWAYNKFTTAARLYAETFNVRNIQEGLYAKQTPVPTWTTHTKDEIVYESPTILKLKFPNLLNSTSYSDYGHYFAMEAPEVFSDSVYTAVAAFLDWHKANGGRDEL